MSDQRKFKVAIVAPDKETGRLPKCSFCGAPTEQVLVESGSPGVPLEEGFTYQASYAVCADCMQSKVVFRPPERPS
jgi:hypothetical protein